MEIKVINNNVEKALRVAKKKLAADGLFRELKRRRFYEKPSVKRKAKEREAARVDRNGSPNVHFGKSYLSSYPYPFSSSQHILSIFSHQKAVMREEQIHAVVKIIKTTIRQWEEPVVGVVARESLDPFRILIACLLSLRTKDQTTAEASQRLFKLAATPAGMRKLPLQRIARAIYPVGFYKNKATQVRRFSPYPFQCK